MRYEDFTVSFTPGPGEGLTIRASSALAGEAEGRLHLQVTSAELGRVAAGVFRAVEAGRQARNFSAADEADPPQELLRNLGDRLFQGLFPERIRSRYDLSLGRLDEREDCGLRIKLQMGLDAPAMARMHEIPWEYLYRRDDRTFLGLGQRTSIVRSLDLPLPADRRALPLPFRVLVVLAEPAGLPPLHLVRECEDLERAWASQAGIEIVFLRHATLDKLRAALVRRKFHVLHFMGHGDFDSTSGQGVLCFEDSSGRAAGVSGDELSAQLRDCTSLRLVFLNACQTARAAAAGPFSGVATALLQAGIPAVIAMQYPISDESAITFSREFYRCLATGEPVDAAVAEGRLAVARRSRSAHEWGTPVLFLRASDGRIFQPRSEPLQPPAALSRPRGSRRGLAFASGLLAAALAVGLMVPQIRDRAIPRPSTDLVRAGPLTSGQERRPDQTADPSVVPQAKHRQLAGRKPAEGTTLRPPEPHAGAKAAVYSVADGQTVYLPEMDCYVSAEFEDLLGQTLVRISLTPKGAPTVRNPPILGAATLDFETPSGRRSLNVTGIDWQRRDVRLLPVPG
jgi:CHAT domain-containing protein